MFSISTLPFSTPNWTRATGWGLALLICAFAAVEAGAAEPRRVLLLHSFGHAFSPWSDMAASFRAELVEQSPEPIDLYEVSLDTARFPAPQEQTLFVEYLRALLSGRKLDLIVPLGAPAAHFVQRHRRQLFPATPMLIAGADRRRVPDTTLSANDAMVASTVDIRAWFDNILRLRPEATNVVVIIGNSPVEKYWLSETLREAQPLADRVNFTWLDKLSFGETLEQVARLTPQSAILYYLMAEDARGVPYSQDRALEALRAVATVPIFGIGDYQLGRGIVGGPLFQSRTLGEQAASVAVRILKGETPGDIKTPPVALSPPVYDWRELRRWGISESRLPPGSIVRYREPPLWEQYRWQIVSIAAALFGQSLLIAGLFYQRRRRRLAEVEVRLRMAELAHMNRAATAGEMSASIAHEINQPLAAIVTSGHAGLRWIAKKVPDLEEVAASLKRIVADGHRASRVIETVRAMFKRDAQDRAVLHINELIREVLGFLKVDFDRHQVSVKSVLSDKLDPVLADRVQLQQVVLNLVRNALEAMSSMTAHARVLQVRTEANDEGGVIISVEDTGPGVDPSNSQRVFEPFFTTKADGMGMGLSICRSIVESHGGRLSLAPAKPHGSIFQILLPGAAALSHDEPAYI